VRPYVIGGACDRVRQQVDTAMIDGVLNLPAALAAHVERCPHCSAEVREVENLLQRLRSLPASIDLSPVPAAVDRVLQATATIPATAAGSAAAPAASVPARRAAASQPASAAPARTAKRRTPQWQWVLGQVAAVAALLIVAAGGLSLLGFRIHSAVSGTDPGGIVERWVAPLRDWSEALFRGTR